MRIESIGGREKKIVVRVGGRMASIFSRSTAVA